MIIIENPKYKSAFLTLLFYVVLFFLIVIRYKIKPSGTGLMILETIAPIALPLISLVFLFKNIWQYFYTNKTNIYSVVIHAIVIITYLFLIIKYLG